MMRAALFHMTSAALLCLTMAPSVGAQTSSSTSAAPRTDQTATQPGNMDKPVTIVGCLVEEKATDAANATDYFVRTPTVVVPVGTSVTVGKPGTTDTTTSSGKPTNDSLYRIIGLNAEELRPHVAHRVEVQGHLSGNKPDAAASGVTTTTTTVDQTGRPTTKVETQVNVAGVLHATAIKMVSASCR